MNPPRPTLENRVSAWVSGWLSKQRLPTDFQVLALAGDGSPRPFYRIRIPGKTFVLLCEPEWRLSKDYAAHQDELKKQGTPVPEFFLVDPALGALLMEDLGDELLQHRILAHPEQKKEWLKKATLLLAQLHGKTFPVKKQLPVFTRRFDTQKYFEEMSFTYEHLVQGFLKLGAPDAVTKKNLEAFCKVLDGFRPDVFSHRDYHTRNLLVHGEKLFVIDFQDARLGPVEYDLASLFFDAYVPIDASDRKLLLGLYKKELQKFPLGAEIAWDKVEDRLNWVALQRVVKAAGSFASFYTRYGKKTHLSYIKPALEMAEELQQAIGDKSPAFPLEAWLKALPGALK